MGTCDFGNAGTKGTFSGSRLRFQAEFTGAGWLQSAAIRRGFQQRLLLT
jgi:hypothetical protein